MDNQEQAQAPETLTKKARALDPERLQLFEGYYNQMFEELKESQLPMHYVLKQWMIRIYYDGIAEGTQRILDNNKDIQEDEIIREKQGVHY